MTLTQLQIFVTIVETGSFTLASERLGMTQSAVSHALADLEKELQVTLLLRERTGPVLTEVGQRIVVLAREMLAAASAIQQTAAATHDLAVGKLRVGSISSVSMRILPGMVRAFQRRYPGIEIVALEGTDQEVREWIETRTVDLGVVTLPAEGVDVTPIASDEFLVVLSAAHPLASKRSVSLEQLAKEPFILSRAGCEPVLLALFREAKVALCIQFEIREIPTILALIEEGIGISIVPEMALPSPRSGLVLLHLRPIVRRQLAFATLSLKTASPAAIMFLQQAQQWAQAQGLLPIPSSDDRDLTNQTTEHPRAQAPPCAAEQEA